jgi:hypothetical protein
MHIETSISPAEVKTVQIHAASLEEQKSIPASQLQEVVRQGSVPGASGGLGAGTDGDVDAQPCSTELISEANVPLTDCSQDTQDETAADPAAPKTSQIQVALVSEHDSIPAIQLQEVLRQGSVPAGAGARTGTGAPLTHINVDWEQTTGDMQQKLPHLCSPVSVHVVGGPRQSVPVRTQVNPI